MIVVDTSALMAILLDEPLADRCRSLMFEQDQILISAGTLAEARIVAARRKRTPELTRLLDILKVSVEDVTAHVTEDMHLAYLRYGKGFHPARLNFGDCFAYALAETRGCPLLYVGNDFARTDIPTALAHGAN